MTRLKLTDPEWMLWRVLAGDEVKLANKDKEFSENKLSRHPVNFLQAIVLGYHGWYKVLPDRWHAVSEQEYTGYFNEPRPPGFSTSRWERIRRPEL